MCACVYINIYIFLSLSLFLFPSNSRSAGADSKARSTAVPSRSTRSTTIITRLLPENCSGVLPLLDIRSLSPPHFSWHPSARTTTTASKGNERREASRRWARRSVVASRGRRCCGDATGRRRSRNQSGGEESEEVAEEGFCLCLSGSANHQLALRSLVLVYLAVSLASFVPPRIPCNLRAYRAPPLCLSCLAAALDVLSADSRLRLRPTALARLKGATERPPLPTPRRAGSAALGRARLSSRPRVMPENDTISLRPVHRAHPKLHLPTLSPFLSLRTPCRKFCPASARVYGAGLVQARSRRTENCIKRRFLDLDNSFHDPFSGEFGSVSHLFARIAEARYELFSNSGLRKAGWEKRGVKLSFVSRITEMNRIIGRKRRDVFQ